MKLRWYTPVLTVLFVTGALGAVSNAHAQEKNDYNEEWHNILGVVGLGQEHQPIDYAPRPILAVPPNYELPPPGSAAIELPAGFPKDPDVEARRKAMLDPRRPVMPGDNPGSHNVRNYLIEPPAEYLDASKVAATGHDAVGAPAEKPKGHRPRHGRSQDQAAAQTPPAPAAAAPH